MGQDVDKGLDGLEAAVVGAGEDGVDGRVEGGQVGCQLVGLVDAVGRQGRVARYARGRLEVGVVLAARGVDQPVGPELSFTLTLVGCCEVRPPCWVVLTPCRVT